jgi:Domain of unknown function (DUF4271)
VRRLFILYCLFISVCTEARAQQLLPPAVLKDSIVGQQEINQYKAVWEQRLSENFFLNSQGTPVIQAVKKRKVTSPNTMFYLLAAVVFLMAVIKFFFNSYFTNLFKIFFNTSFRQTQLVDQLVQAKLPSLFFNVFFAISSGLYVYLLLQQYKLIAPGQQWIILGYCILTISIIYMIKYSTLKFTGWVTGYTNLTNPYIFIIFLISKIIGITLIPFTVLMAFSDAIIAKGSGLIALLIIGFLIALRFIRSYSLVQKQLKVSWFHFVLYIAGVEILPLLLIYKGLMILLNKNT